VSQRLFRRSCRGRCPGPRGDLAAREEHCSAAVRPSSPASTISCRLLSLCMNSIPTSVSWGYVKRFEPQHKTGDALSIVSPPLLAPSITEGDHTLTHLRWKMPRCRTAERRGHIPSPEPTPSRLGMLDSRLNSVNYTPDSPTTSSGSARALHRQEQDDRACLADSTLCNGREIACVATPCRCKVGRMLTCLANRTRARTARTSKLRTTTAPAQRRA
jgi:hypothetical protein